MAINPLEHPALTLRGPETRAWHIKVFDREARLLLETRPGETGRPPTVFANGVERLGGIGGLVIDAHDMQGNRLFLLEYGAQRSPDGKAGPYDTLVLRLRPVVAVLLWTVIAGELFVGGTRNLRSALKALPDAQPRFEVIRGYVDPGESPLEAACRELREEAGCTDVEPVLLPGTPVQMLPGWMVSVPGETFFAAHVPSERLADRSRGNVRQWGFRSSGALSLDAYEQGQVGEPLFVPCRQVVAGGDASSIVAVARLRDWLEDGNGPVPA